MGFTIEELAQIRPFAYHNSGLENFKAIRRHGRLRSTRTILQGTNYEHLIRSRRNESLLLAVDGEEVVVRDNRPLRPGSVELTGGWSLTDLLTELNSRVFLWPGTERGPIDRGRSHFGRYAAEGPVFAIRIPTLSVVAANHGRQLWVTRCNSGSARHHGGKRVPRGPSTFQLPEDAGFRPPEVVELSYVGDCLLPDDAMWSHSLAGPWRRLADAA